jgi:RNA polymerase sigma-70 factor (ECF subfamily)
VNSPRPHPGTSLLTRPTLLFRVREWQDAASWAEFHRLYRRLIYGRARRAGLAHEDAEDVAQDVFKRVAETIKDFDLNPDRGSFRGWLMQLTHWRIADQFERRGKLPASAPASPRDSSTAGETATLERVPAPADDEDEWDREWQRHILAAAVERLARQVKPRHFQVFELYVRQSWPVLKVSAELGINPASVYVIGHRLTKQLKAEVEKLRGQLG